MELTPQEIISTIQAFPISVQTEIVETLQKNLRKTAPATPTEDEIERLLFASGLIGEIPKRVEDKEEETYSPVELTGKPLSETVLEERE